MRHCAGRTTGLWRPRWRPVRRMRRRRPRRTLRRAIASWSRGRQDRSAATTGSRLRRRGSCGRRPKRPQGMRLADALRVALELSRAPSQATVDEIERAARAARVPVAVALAVCQVESGIGTRGAILCGCGRDRGVRAQARCASATLAHGRRLCGGWDGALRRYRWGACASADPTGYVRRVGAAVAQVTRRASPPSSRQATRSRSRPRLPRTPSPAPAPSR